ncbi:hypothetical protein HHI36_015201 [Cryptolaemus montrouzieri]|uniref:Uncharacterized protein n=1 Tax=Cryptolaemus montrouzieri TaxID=559131 RepID=A0ABD2N5F2_9CUCU
MYLKDNNGSFTCLACTTRSKLRRCSSSSVTIDKDSESVHSEDQPISLKRFNELLDKISELSVGIVSLSFKTNSADVSVITNAQSSMAFEMSACRALSDQHESYLNDHNHELRENEP